MLCICCASAKSQQFACIYKRSSATLARIVRAARNSCAARPGDGVVPSMSRKGNCYDKADMESFWRSLKQERVHRCQFATRAQAQAAIFEWIEVFYNREWFHRARGRKSPVDFEQPKDRVAEFEGSNECGKACVRWRGAIPGTRPDRKRRKRRRSADLRSA